jgi:hypothetical protein
MRFFNRSFALPVPKLKDYLNQLPSVSILKERLVKTSEFDIFDIDDESAINLMCMVFEGFNLDLRSVNQIVERVGSILTNHEDELGVLILLTLESLRVKNRSAYDDLWSSKKLNNQVLGEYIERLALNNEANVLLTMNIKVQGLRFISNSRSHYIKQNNIFSLMGIMTNVLFKKINTPITSISVTDTYDRYFDEIIMLEGGNIQRFKDYVELAANLS